MFSREFLGKSSQLARWVPANQRTCAITLFKQSEGSNSLPVAASLSRSSFGGSNNGGHKSGDAFLKFLLRSVASGVVIACSNLSFSYWYPSSVDKCSFVSFADSADDAAWVSRDDLLPHKKKKRFLFGGTSVIFLFTYNFGFWIEPCIIYQIFLQYHFFSCICTWDDTDFFNTWYWVLLCIIYVDCFRFIQEKSFL